MIYCEDCKWFKEPQFNWLPPKLSGYCLNSTCQTVDNPLTYLYRSSKVTFETAFATSERLLGICGKDGKNYERK
jgi:hypothetical protein